MERFLFDFRVLIERMLLVENRQPVFIAWIYDLTAYLRKIHADFIAWGTDKIDEITWNAGTMNLEEHLKLVFADNGIYIQNNFRPALPQFGYPYTDSRNKENYPYSNTKNRVLYEYGTYDNTVKAFIIFVPVALVFDEIKMRAIVEKYKLLGTDYTIETY